MSVISLPATGQGWDFRQCPNGPVPGAIGGYEYGGAQYLFLYQGSEFLVGDSKIHALKSTDLGVTWTDTDSILIPPVVGGPTVIANITYTTCMDGTTVYLMAVDLKGTGTGPSDVNAGPLLLYTYSLISNAFSSASISGAPTISKGWNGSSYSPNSQICLHLLRRGSGDMLLLYTGMETIGANKWARIYVATFNGSSCGSGTMLPGQAGTAGLFIEACATVDTSGNLHVILTSNADTHFYYHIGMSPAGAFGTFQTIETDAYYSNLTSNLLDFNAGADTIAFLGIRNRSSSAANGDLAIYSAAGGSLSPTWGFHNLPSTANPVPDNIISPGWVAALGFLNGTLYAFWTQNGVPPSWSVSAKQGEIHSSTATATDLSTWTAEASVMGPYDTGTAHWGAGQVGVWAGTTIGLGVVGNFEGYDSGGSGDPIEMSKLVVYAPAGGPGSPSVTCGSPPSGTVGVAYTHTFPATGGTAPYTFAITTGTLPPGLSLASSTGSISGTPTMAGTYPITVTVTDASSATGSADCSISVGYGALSTTCGSPPAYTVGVPGTPYRPSVMAGSIGLPPVYDQSGTLLWTFPPVLPPGFHWQNNPSAPNYGYLVGTPTTAGIFDFTYTVSTIDGQSVTNSCPITVAPAGGGGGGGTGGLDISCGNPPAGKVGVVYFHDFPVTGATGPTTYSVVVGALPPGVTLNPATGELSGTPTAPGTYSFSVKVQQ